MRSQKGQVRAPRGTSSRRVQLIVIAAASLAYFVTGKLGLRLAYLHESATPVWAPTGIAITAFLVAGRRVWPGIFLGAFLVNITTAGSWLSTLGIATGNTLEGWLGAYLATRFANGTRAFERATDVVRFSIVACMISPVVSATFGVTSLCLAGFAAWSSFAPIWITWWLGNAVGALLVSSTILVWLTSTPLYWTSRQAIEGAALIATIVIWSTVVFGGLFPYTYVLFPVVLWAAFRFGLHGTTVALTVIFGVALWKTLGGEGPFAADAPNSSLVRLQSYVGVSGVTSLVVAATVSERQRAGRALQDAHDQLDRRVTNRTRELSTANEALRAEVVERSRAEERFRRLVESAPDAMVIAGADGTIVLINSRTERMFGYTRDELVGKSVETLVPQRLHERHVGHRAGYAADPRGRPMGLGIELFGVRKDGEEFSVEISLSPIETEEGPLVCAAIRDTTEQKRLEEELEAIARMRAEDLREFAISVQRAQEEERRRIARELHDDFGQRLTGLKLSLQAMEDDIPEDAHSEPGRLQRFQDDIDRLINELRRMSYNLRPSTLDDFGLVVALDVLCKDFAKLNRLDAQFSADDRLRPSADANVDIAIYRIAQEALANVAKHAEATQVKVRLERRNGLIAVTVEDNGNGFDMESARRKRKTGHGLGLVSMRERAELLGGSFLLESVRRGGTTVHAEFPVAEGDQHEVHSNTHRG